ncbi:MULTISPECIES: SDR family NAD(P)-dependent oxidoreductase [unclassified Sphingobium]|uniref:SDR family NAD(P)-dependent oxidoreductase n=1 Tax=unclassified Sphingobium TaxID=2611147 RepID=UPI0035A6C0F0
MAQVIDMSGKVALVTGAAAGLGRATALRLAEAGARLVLVDVDAAGLAATAALIPGADVVEHVANLADPDACIGAVQAAVTNTGRLDALCNIAGIIRMWHSTDMPRRDFELTMAINLHAPWYLSQAAIPHLLETNGAIVNCASTAAYIGEAYCAAYCATKAGVVQMTKALAMEYMRQPIRINAVAPGGMNTDISKTMTLPTNPDRELMSRFYPLRGMVELDDVAEIIAMLASPAGRSYHGACLTIDAGITAG